MSTDAKLIAAAELADHYIEIILSEEPALLVEKIADQGAKDIAKSAKALAEFRLQLAKALAEQPIPEYFEESEEEEEESEEESAEDGEEAKDEHADK
ncbi:MULTISPECIES: hypothetical protein [unclassified Variovorax]|jgi:hypothetical protein|uniref:hypothetical protein n=1 Tax=unclassified Variovorax TaxID=663243 RepID=UPI0008E755D9|nr:hypothetical protein [Variovorax sp. PDC80]SFO82821.1 hypothetical protein SAMN05443579_106360 [Variovorax sp. PDC80]